MAGLLFLLIIIILIVFHEWGNHQKNTYNKKTDHDGNLPEVHDESFLGTSSHLSLIVVYFRARYVK